MTVRLLQDADTELFAKILAKPKTQQALELFAQALLTYNSQQSNMHQQLAAIDLAYMREPAIGQALESTKKTQNTLPSIVVPVVMPQVEAGVAHLTGALLSGTPIMAVIASPDKQDSAEQLEAVMYENSQYAGWKTELTKAFRHGLKYNIQATEVNWDTEVSYMLKTDPTFKSGAEGKPDEVIWEGNKIKALDPYNFIADNRCDPGMIHKEGEFAGYLELKSKIAMRMMFISLGKDVFNFKRAMESPINLGAYGYYVPQLNSNALYTTPSAGITGTASTDWIAYATSMVSADNKMPRINYQTMYELFTCYCRILPEEFGMNVEAKDHPQIWKFIFCNGVLIYGRRQTNAHNWLPIIVSQPLSDGLGVQTKSFANNIICYQDLATALWGAKLSSERRKVIDRMLYDVSRIRKEDIENPSATAKIPVRPGAFGKGIGDAFALMPFRDDSAATLLAEANQVVNMAYEASGLNKPAVGQFQRGNKTVEEFRTTMQNSGQVMDLLTTNVAGSHLNPAQRMIVMNTQQYQTPTQIAMPSGASTKLVQVDPVGLRNSQFTYKIANGLDPVRKLIDSDFLGTFMQLYQTVPQMQTEFDMVSLVDYWAKVEGSPSVISAFRRTPERQAQIMQQQVAARGAQGVGVPTANPGGN